MSGTFDPGPGWKPADGSGDLRDVERLMLVNKSNTRVAAWVREAPVPPLPTEPYTVIRVTWDAAKVRSTDVTCTLVNGYWRGLADFLSANDLADRITGFVVLSEPRAVTAKAVLDQLLRRLDGHPAGYDHKVRQAAEAVVREFGVES